MKRSRFSPRFWSDRRGVAAIEFAIVAPVLVVMMFGMIIYGGWFWMAHSVQSLATEAARTAIAGLDPTEREQLARAFVTSQAPSMGLDTQKTTVEIQADPNVIRVNVAYDIRQHPLMALSGLVPSPPRIIRRTATVRLGGY
ncbi:TadE/TadG family type IV pilus assembly protein [Brevundimonas faecalis]|uniref:Flp pilus assembly protein TadG n=1 Tax=Brevundimonas faecalis TaxID=947378 RepID=A0ABV2RCT3_9CAUL